MPRNLECWENSDSSSRLLFNLQRNIFKSKLRIKLKKLVVYNIIRINISIKYLSWDWPWLSLHACLDLYLDWRCCLRSQSRRSRHGSSQPDPTFKTSSSSRTALHVTWSTFKKSSLFSSIESSTSSPYTSSRHRRRHHVMSTLLSETPSACRRRTRGSIMTLWIISWNCDISKASMLMDLNFKI
jgi:hypothetical protein